MPMQYKAIPTEFKIDEEKRILQAYASCFGNRDAGGDIVEPGFFADCLANPNQAKRVKVCWQHDPWEPIGKPLIMREDSKGLYTESYISKTEAGNKAVILINDGVVTEMSMGYDTETFSLDEPTQTRHLIKGILWEYSPVTWAMNELADIVGMKSADSFDPLFMRLKALYGNLTDDQKAGRVLSAGNRDKVENAIAALQALIAAADKEEEGDKDKSIQDNQEKKTLELLGNSLQNIQATSLEMRLGSALREVSKSLHS